MSKLPYEDFKGLHEGETCVIVCNGPSLREVDDKFLYKYPTFGTNLICLREGFAPTYYVALGKEHFGTDQRDLAVWNILYNEHNESVFVNRMWEHRFRHNNVWTMLSGFYYGNPNWIKKEDGQMEVSFSLDPLNQFTAFGSTTYAEIQLAAYMGFKTMLFVGLDHDYSSDEPHFYTNEESDRFDFPRNDNDQHVQTANLAFATALVAGKSLGIRFANLTPESKCTVFEMGNIDDWR